MTFPTGPTEVGLEPIVLPVSASIPTGATGRDSSTCLVVAPTCRFGEALYHPVSVWAGGELVADEEDLVASGGWCMCPLPIREAVLRVELRMLLLNCRPGAFAALALDDLALALQHPLANVREAAFMAIGR